MPKFNVLVTEIYQKTVVINAKNEREARIRASDAWNNTEIILEPEDCFQGAEFFVTGIFQGEKNDKENRRAASRYLHKGGQAC